MRRRRAGFSVIELLCAVAILGLVMAATSISFATQGRAYLFAETQTTMEANLRLGMNMVTGRLRNAGYGVPAANLANWVTWVPGFTGNPTITINGTAPAVLSVASATSQPVATLTARGYVGDTTLYLSDASELDAAAKGLLLIGDSENALVKNVNGTQVTIDTSPLTGGYQGLARSYPAGTPVYRVDVVTYRVATGASELLRDDNQGSGLQAAAEGITNLQLATVTPGKVYDVTLTGRSPRPDPLTGKKRTSSLRSRVTLTN
jgi:prepilin-type N-terminal cleavage/methylation domain-containing protein